MDPSRPATVDPRKFIRTIIDHRVTYSFGSPAIWDVVSRFCKENGIVLPVNKILMAGAPVSGDLVQRVAGIMDPAGEVHTPYGATESLPVTSISGREILDETWKLTRTGAGTCVGRPLPGMTVRIMAAADVPVSGWDEAEELGDGEIGEIVVRGPVVTREYDQNDLENRLAKMEDHSGLWHRMGDMGYLDGAGRLWFCGRKAHRVRTAEGVMYTIPCESIFNEHPDVKRSALVGVGETGCQRPVVIVELAEGKKRRPGLGGELQDMARRHTLTRSIATFLIHPGFPVDIRHNAKIFREKLAVWAREQLGEFG
jgi:acyl-CoA synthetase (AMP-forming)/AMP-acid ligase II